MVRTLSPGFTGGRKWKPLTCSVLPIHCLKSCSRQIADYLPCKQIHTGIMQKWQFSDYHSYWANERNTSFLKYQCNGDVQKVNRIPLKAGESPEQYSYLSLYELHRAKLTSLILIPSIKLTGEEAVPHRKNFLKFGDSLIYYYLKGLTWCTCLKIKWNTYKECEITP